MGRNLRIRILDALNGAKSSTFDDGPGSWQEASARASGYDSGEILRRVSEATRSVIAGDARYERDGVLFQEAEYRWPVAYALCSSAARHGALRVLDVGGSLGSVYWQHRDLLDGIDVSWTVIEQESFVAEGRAHVSPTLEFAHDLAEAQRFGPWHIALFSSVLQYLPDPWTQLLSVLDSGIDTVVIDRTPLHPGDRDIATVQVVPADIYPASYPAWILSESRLQEVLEGWRIIARFPGIEPPMRTVRGIDFTWSGLIARRADA